MKFATASQRPRTLEQDMTPLIDIVFQLLIFFLTTTQLAAMARVELELPRERGARQASRDPKGLIVNLRRDGSLVVLERTVDRAELALLARRAVTDGEGVRPVVRADRGAPADRLNAVLETLRDAGVEGISLATSPGR